MHIREHFKENHILNIYQLTIFNNPLFLHRIKNGKVTSIFLSKFLRPSHNYLTSFSQNNYVLASTKKQVQNNDPHSEIVEYYLECRRKTFKKSAISKASIKTNLVLLENAILYF